MAEKKPMKKEEPKAGPKGKLVAKKDFAINHNEYHKVIKTGDDISDVPAMYHVNLKTEGVL